MARAGRQAFVEVMGAEEDADCGVVLLGHCREAFDADRPPDERMTTAELLRALVGRGDDSPWAGWWGRTSTRDIRGSRPCAWPRCSSPTASNRRNPVRKHHVKGYERGDFADAFLRYLPCYPFLLPKRSEHQNSPSSEREIGPVRK